MIFLLFYIIDNLIIYIIVPFLNSIIINYTLLGISIIYNSIFTVIHHTAHTRYSDTPHLSYTSREHHPTPPSEIKNCISLSNIINLVSYLVHVKETYYNSSKDYSTRRRNFCGWNICPTLNMLTKILPPKRMKFLLRMVLLNWRIKLDKERKIVKQWKQ